MTGAAHSCACVFGRFMQADTLVPEPGNPQALNRYAYVYNSPVRYMDLNGQGPLDVVRGAVFQYVEDVTLGVAGIGYKAIYGMSVELAFGGNPDFAEGREYGRAASQAQGRAQVVAGVALAGIGLASGPPTAGVAAAAAVPTGGLSLVGGAVVLTAEGVMVLGGTALASYGGILTAHVQGNPLPQVYTRNNFAKNLRKLTGMTREDTKGLEAHHVLPREFESQFRKLGINIHDPKYGSWVELHCHRSFSTGYNKRWGAFLAQRPRSIAEVGAFGRQMGRLYGFDIHY